MAVITGKYYNGTEAVDYEPEKFREAKAEYFKNAQAYVEGRVTAKKKIHTVSFSSVAVIIVSSLLILASAVIFMISTSEYHDEALLVESLKKECQELLTENSLLENQIDKNTDYEAIYEYATEVLGMRMPTADQIVRYPYHAREYVSRDEMIPND